MLGPSAISTGYFFHQRFLAELNGWSLELLAGGVALTALTSAISAVASGALVDCFTAVRVSRFYLVPLALASLALAVVPGPSGALIFFGLMGLTSGSSSVVVTAVLVEIFGAGQIGMVRALAASIMVVASAITPGLFGIVLDLGAGVVAIACASAVYLLGATLLLQRLR
jgi:MFS family permease